MHKVKILGLTAHVITDSRGEPTLAVELQTECSKGVASVPSGASVGAHEAHELRDGDAAVNHGRGVLKAVAYVNETIASATIGKLFDQAGLDVFLCELDGTPNKSRLGANAILGVSIAFARAQAQEQNLELYEYLGSLDGNKNFKLPQPLFNILNGGKHTSKGIDIQECMLAPVGFTSVRQSIEVVQSCVSILKSLLETRGYSTRMGDEGGFAPALTSNDEALDLLIEAITKAGYSTEQIKIALDVAASSFYTNGEYMLRSGQATKRTPAELLAWYGTLAKTYPLISIEDGFAEDDWAGFTALTKELGSTHCIVGDDLTVTNTQRIAIAVGHNAANACIIKPNQVGTVTETIAAVHAARDAGWKIFASHRSGETLDTFIADFAVGLSCDYIKAGAPTREERMVKYARLVEIEDKLNIL